MLAQLLTGLIRLPPPFLLADQAEYKSKIRCHGGRL